MKTLLFASLFLITGTVTVITATENTHHCICGQRPVNEKGIDCKEACKTSGGWSGQAIISETVGFKGIKCKCNHVVNGENVYIKYPCAGAGAVAAAFGNCVGHSGWTRTVHSAKTNKDISVEVGQQKLDHGDGTVTDLGTEVFSVVDRPEV